MPMRFAGQVDSIPARNSGAGHEKLEMALAALWAATLAQAQETLTAIIASP